MLAISSRRQGGRRTVRRASSLALIEATDLPDYGDPEAGDPIQCDELRIEHDQGDVEIVVYNRAILLFFTDSEAVRWIHEACCRLDDITEAKPR